jgi:hypothetical protein
MAANFTQFPIETATITERAASNPATLPLAGTEGLLIDQGGITKGATAADIAATLPEATTTAAGKLSAGDKTKIDSIASNATANASDAELRDRATHTGEQAISTVTGLQTALDGKEAAGAAASAQSAAISAAATDATTKAACSSIGSNQRSSDRRDHKGRMQLNRQQSAQQRQTRPQRPMQLNRQQSAQQRQTRPQRPAHQQQSAHQLSSNQRSSDRRDHKGQCSSISSNQRSSDRRDHKGQCSSISSNCGIGPCRSRRY